MSECQESLCCPKDPFSYSIEGATIFYNTRQCFTATCPDGSTGDPVQRCVEAGQYHASAQAAADALALAAATSAANAALSCSGGSGCTNQIPQMTGYTTPSGLVTIPTNVSVPSGNESWRAFTAAGEYKPGPFSSGEDKGHIVCIIGYRFAAARKAAQFATYLGAINVGQLINFVAYGYSDTPAGWPVAWAVDNAFIPGGFTYLGQISAYFNGASPITFNSLDATTAFKFFLLLVTAGPDPPYNPIAVKGLQICGST